MSRIRRPLAALAILTLIVVGCSNAPAETGTGSSGGNHTAVTLIASTDAASIVTAPAVTAPAVTAPAVTAPAVTAPAVTAPAVTAPTNTEPTNTAPADTGSSAGDTAAAAHEQAVKFAECMRANGVSKFPDPDASGTLTLDGVVNGSSLDPSSAAFKQAIDACKDLQPPGFTGRKRSPQEQEAALKFAQCIRDNGVPDFPDPTIDGPIIDTNRIPSAANGDLSMLRAAGAKCRNIIADQLKAP